MSFETVQQERQAALRQFGPKRLIGPVPPRFPDGRFKIKPILEERPKLNAIGTPIIDARNQPVMEQVDVRSPIDYRVYSADSHADMLPDATKGLRLFEIDYAVEPRMQVYARTGQEAVEVWKKEFGIIKLSGDYPDPLVTAVA